MPRRGSAQQLAGRLARRRSPPPRLWPSRLHGRPPAAGRGALEGVLDAVRRRDAGALAAAFVAWTALLRQPGHPTHGAAVDAARRLPATAVSEVVRSLDPVADARLDVAHGLTIGAGEAHFTPSHALVDDFGVRRHHGQVLLGLQALLRARGHGPGPGPRPRPGPPDTGLDAGPGARPCAPLAPADYEALLRCAAAAADRLYGKHLWAAMTAAGLQRWRTPRTWVEFLRGRFMTHPVYYQFDRTRVLTLARDLHREARPLSLGAVKRLDRIRLGLNALAHHPWNRDPARPELDWRRALRRRRGHASFFAHFHRFVGLGHRVDEDFLCASMVAFARAGEQRAICRLVLERHYAITVVRDQAAFAWTVAGGRDLDPDSPIRPTARLLDAVVDAFAGLANLPLALDLLQHISRRYAVPIPPATWSNLLRWAYINASSPYRQMREAEPRRDLRPATIEDPLFVWRTMTAPPYSVRPSFDDYCCRVKMLVRMRALAPAVDDIRRHLVPHYRACDAAYHRAVVDELLANDAAARDPPAASRRRRRAEALKDHARYHVARCLHLLLKTASQNAAHRRGRVMRVLVPDLLAEFGDFLPHAVAYRTEKGLVVIHRPDAPRRFAWVRAWRTTLPASLSSGCVDREGPVEAKDWPRSEDLRILGWHREPAPRRPILGRAPAPVDEPVVTDATDVSKLTSADYKLSHEGTRWFRRLERELML